MINLEINETKRIIGGASSGITGAFLSSLKGIFGVFFEIGQAFGGAIRRISSSNLCNF